MFKTHVQDPRSRGRGGLGSRRAIADPVNAFAFGAMRAAIHVALRLDAMPDNTAVAVRTFGRQGLNRALEALEGHGPAALRNAHGPVVIVAADVTACHGVRKVDSPG